MHIVLEMDSQIYMSIILMLDSSISLSSSMTETCDNCETIRQQNRKLTKQLTGFLQYQQELLILKKVKKELEDIETIGAEYNITMADFAQAIAFTLDNHFAIKSKPFIQKAKVAIKHIQSLSEKEPEKKDKQYKQEFKVIKEEKAKVEQKPKAIVHYERAESTTQKIQKKESPIEESKSQPTQKQPRLGIFQELNSFKKKEKRESNPYFPAQDTPSGHSNFEDSPHNQPSFSNRSNAGDLCLPLNWEKRTFFDMTNKTITKKFNDIYKKICTETPLPKRGEHKIKFEMVTKGTWAVGIVPAAFKDRFMIDDRKCDAVKYLSFDNGGGLINLSGEKIANGDHVHLKPGQVLQIDFNADIPSVTFKNPNMRRPLKIELTEGFKGKDLYFFLEMKDFNTAVRMLSQ